MRRTLESQATPDERHAHGAGDYSPVVIRLRRSAASGYLSPDRACASRGLGVYDIHSPRVPTREEMAELLLRAGMVLPAARLRVNPDCGLKTRGWPEVETTLVNMAEAAKSARHPVGWYDIMSDGPLYPSRCPLCRQQNKCSIAEDSGTC